MGSRFEVASGAAWQRSRSMRDKVKGTCWCGLRGESVLRAADVRTDAPFAEEHEQIVMLEPTIMNKL